MDDLREVIENAIWDKVDPLSGDPIGALICASDLLFPSKEHQQGNSTSKSYELAAKEVCGTITDAALAAIKQAGFVVVPAEPTEAMVEAFGNATGFDFHNSIADGYRAMIEASNAPT
ncbi:hypothetical protein CMI47_05280 [Candidatus Pacearchaeota archaeon]|jgi:hypothetical protein|nr:hypothetical protein [Candidatus Pacearchaeota archaeon]|tara:strand:- start:3529 stop:3879 length:351 start_codon:yes stop_codon:yes gene_type:complete